MSLTEICFDQFPNQFMLKRNVTKHFIFFAWKLTSEI